MPNLAGGLAVLQMNNDEKGYMLHTSWKIQVLTYIDLWNQPSN